jgi:hypothetical protein
MGLPKDGKLHKPPRAINRKEAREVYHNYEMKRDLTNQFMYDRTKELYSSFYGGIDPRRKGEMADAGMIHEDQTAMANLPKEGYQNQYPRAGYYSSNYIDDSVKE